MADSRRGPSHIIDHVFVGSRADAKDKERLLELGITHILNVTPTKTADPVAGVANFFEKDKCFVYSRCAVMDNRAENLAPLFSGCIAFIEQAKFYGMSRSVSMVMAYLMQNHSMGYDDALALVKRQRPVAQPNAGFEAQLRAFAERVSRSRERAQPNAQRPTAKRRAIGPSRPPTSIDDEPTRKPISRASDMAAAAAVRIIQQALGLPPPADLLQVHGNQEQDDPVAISIVSAARTGDVTRFERAVGRLVEAKTDPCVVDHELNHAAKVAAMRGHSDIVRRVVSQHGPHLLMAPVMDAVARRGDLSLLQWLFERRADRPISVLVPATRAAAEGGHVPVLEWIMSVLGRGEFPREAMADAVDRGHVPAAQWFKDHGLHTGVVLHAYVPILAGHVDMVKWLRENQLGVFDSMAIAASYQGGHLPLIQLFLDEDLIERSPLLTSATMWSGHWELSQYFDVVVGVGCPYMTLWGAARLGRIDLCSRLLERYPEFATQTMNLDHACEAGDVAVLEWIDKHLGEHATFSKMGVVIAARGGHLPVVQWLHQRVLTPWSKEIMDVAAEEGHLALLQWLHEHRSEGCSKKAMDSAAAKNQHHVVQWLHTNRSEGCTTRAMNDAAAAGHLEMLQWLHANRDEGCTVNAMNRAAGNGHLAVLQFLHANRAEGCTSEAMRLAAANGHLDVLIWLHEHRSEQWTPETVDSAAANGHLAIVKWLLSCRPEGFTSRALRQAELHKHVEICALLRRHER
ncbi:hypothetical protein P43SY_005056 [Pythium insidiosum]|uniref:Tyrosine-protein phosphatase domain-containing protein n=1 Tax=Pythium insidiosum TaxID=114742 RepID=A0AAD5M5S2_PYTIN|nr:hypothetical protein P43SY_005056 [Pythium insidiosum]